MYIFNINKDIRRYGLNTGLPAIFIECGFGQNLKTEDVVRRLSTMGLVKGCWVVIKNGASEQGMSSLAELLSKAGCRVEIEVKSSEPTPKYFTKADRWTVIWDGRAGFNINALRKGQDIYICPSNDLLPGFVDSIESYDTLTLGIFSHDPNMDIVWPLQMRVFEVQESA